jgi:alcohol dehydrogenase class IV
MRTTFTFHSAGQIIFGRDAVLQLGDVVRWLAAGRVLVITDAALGSAGVVERVRSSLAAAQVEVAIFEGGVPEPPLALGETCAAAAQRFRAQAVLGLGAAATWTWPRLPPRF